MTHTLTIPFGPLSIRLECHYLPAIRSRLEASTGLPVEPDTEEEFEILSATIEGVDASELIETLGGWGEVEGMARKQL